MLLPGRPRNSGVERGKKVSEENWHRVAAKGDVAPEEPIRVQVGEEDIAIYRRAFSHDKPVLERQIHKGAMPATENGGYGIPEDIVLPTSTISFLGGDIACPNQAQTIESKVQNR